MSANNILQRQIYSMHKSRPLIKPTMIGSTDGYIVSAMGPYLADTKDNDASIIKHILLNNREGIVDWLHPSDILIVSRGSRDCLPVLKVLGYETYVPAFLKESRQTTNHG